MTGATNWPRRYHSLGGCEREGSVWFHCSWLHVGEGSVLSDRAYYPILTTFVWREKIPLDSVGWSKFIILRGLLIGIFTWLVSEIIHEYDDLALLQMVGHDASVLLTPWCVPNPHCCFSVAHNHNPFVEFYCQGGRNFLFLPFPEEESMQEMGFSSPCGSHEANFNPFGR